MASADPSRSRTILPTIPVLGVVIALATIVLLGALLPTGGVGQGPLAVGLLLLEGWPALLWLLAALGLGCVAERVIPVLARSGPDGRIRRAWPLGIALLVVIDATLGTLGLLGRGHEVVAWLVLVVPALGLLLAGPVRDLDPRPDPTASWLRLPIAIPLGVLALAAASTPGWLWESEFGGYDVLSYHLQLPREWWIAGVVIETPHNAYGYLPGGMSAAFLHLMTVVGDPGTADIGCQVLVAGLTVIAAIATADLAESVLGAHDRRVRAIAMVALLATPWVIVTGSLAYDEGFVVLMLAAAATRLIGPPAAGPGRLGDAARGADISLGAVVGLLLGAAVLGKASSGLLVVLPAAALAAVVIPPRRWLRIVPATAVVGVAACLPWLVRNWDWTGNPLFPFATALFGTHDWTAEQVDRFARAHGGLGWLAGGRAFVAEFLLHDLFLPEGSNEPRRPQWSWLPIAGLTALAVLLLRPTTAEGSRDLRRRVGGLGLALLLMLAAWALATHAKARFLLPAAPLMAALVAVVLRDLLRRDRPRLAVAVAAWVAALAPAWIYATDRDGLAPQGVGVRALLDGTADLDRIAVSTDPEAIEIRRGSGPATLLRELPEGSEVVLLGIADPWHLPMSGDDPGAPRLRYSTVWTRGPVERTWAGMPDAVEPRSAARGLVEGLRNEGVTHILVAPTMLEVWSRSGWLDPAIDPARVRALVESDAVSIAHRFLDGAVLLDIAPEPAP